MKVRPGTMMLIGVVLVSNAIALIGVRRNRSAAVQTIELTERELPLLSRGDESSGPELRIAWGPGTETFDEAKLAELGFRFPPVSLDQHRDVPPRPALAVLAYGVEPCRDRPHAGTYPNAAAPPIPRISPWGESRLCVVDAGLSYDGLRARYPDAAKHLIVRAVVSAYLEWNGTKNSPSPISIWHGRVSQILPGSIFVPAPLSRRLANLPPMQGTAPRYSVILEYGGSLEPWVAGLRPAG